ncbi:MAG TPA: hypothetical protein VHU44_11395 [Acidobacteriaceae bacterium]|nr:hypothetical protein [Acidobacteriaceae bacterium]
MLGEALDEAAEFGSKSKWLVAILGDRPFVSPFSIGRLSGYILVMVGNLASAADRSTHSSWLRSFVAVLCITLLLFGGMLSVTHSHAANGGSHPDCGLCLVAHAAIHTGAPAPEISVVQVFTPVEASPKSPDLPSVSLQPLFSRPPPADLNRA